MRKISKEELKKILENHEHWLKQNVEGWEMMHARLCGADLSGMDLSRMDLSGAILSNTDLSGANLSDTLLCNANLRGANLRGANLSYTDFRGATLSDADLSETDLRRTDLYEASLNNAILPNQELMNSKLPICCPEEGSFIGWKSAHVISPGLSTGRFFTDIICYKQIVIVKLLILNTAKRSSATSRKCRCNEAEVLDIQSTNGASLPKGIIAHSLHDYKFTYEIGKTVKVEDFDENRWNECSTGIHFFITRKEAVDYQI